MTWPDLRGQNNTSVREGNLRQLLLRISRPHKFSAFMFAVATCCTLSGAQQTAPESDKALVDSVQELRSQVQELRAAVAEIRTEASQYRAESEELRREIDSLRRRQPLGRQHRARLQPVRSRQPHRQNLPSTPRPTKKRFSCYRTKYVPSIRRRLRAHPNTASDFPAWRF